MEPPATTATTGIYCKACGYDLRASGEAGRCPECGRVFSPADPKTFRNRPFAAAWQRALGRWAKRGAILLLALGLLLGGVWGWYYRGLKQEQAALAQVGGRLHLWTLTILGGTPGEWLHNRHFPGSFVLERVSAVSLISTATDADLLPLRQLRLLEVLQVEVPITDAGMAQLRHCPRLRQLSIVSPRVTDTGLATLRDLPHLEELILDAVPITDAGLVHVAKLPGLKRLVLLRVPLTGADLAHLAPLWKITDLNLVAMPITDADLVPLEKLTGLKELRLKWTKVTPAGVARLKAALPGCNIVGP